MRHHQVAALLLLAGLSGTARAADTAAFLKIGVGARAAGMGGAYTALADDVSAVHWNPAGLGQLGKRELGAMDARLFADTRLNFVGYAQPMKSGGVLGFSGVFLGQGAIEERDENRQLIGSYTAADRAVGVSYSLKASESVLAGGTLKVVESRIADASAAALAADLGLLWKSPIAGATAGLSVRNLGRGLKFYDERDDLPLTLALGAAYRLPIGVSLAADFSRQAHAGRNAFGFGTEYAMFRALALRAGYLSALSGGEGDGRLGALARSGVGAGIGLRLGRMSFDYAFTPYGELGGVQRLSLGARF